MKKSKRNHFIIIISLLVLLLGGGVILLLNQKQQAQTTENFPVSSPTKNNNPKDQSNDNPNPNNPKKILSQQIKADLQKDLEEAKKEEKSKNGFGGCSWLKTLGEDCGMYRGNEWRLNYYGSDMDKWKEKQHPGAREGIYVFPEELEPNDWKEIESLIQQVKELENKKNKLVWQNYHYSY